MTTKAETAKHTPGPWSVRQRETTFDIEAGEMHVLRTSWHNAVRNPYPLKNEALANAMVAAAAPEILELLSRATDASSPNDDVRTAWWEARNAAIAKATGVDQ